MMTKIDFEFDFNIKFPLPTLDRRVLAARQLAMKEARKRLFEQGAKKGQIWDFTTNAKESKNGTIFNQYNDEFSLEL